MKNFPAMQKTWARSLYQEDPLQKEVATHSSILAWRIPWTEEPGGLESMGWQESDTTQQLNKLNELKIHNIMSWLYIHHDKIMTINLVIKIQRNRKNFFLWLKLLGFTLDNFHILDTAELILFTMLYISSLVLTGSLYPWTAFVQYPIPLTLHLW